MGTTGTYIDKGMSTLEFFQREFPTSLTERGEVLASSCAGGNFYAAVRTHATGEVWALVVRVDRTGAKFGPNIYYKEMDENMGPNLIDCPDRVLDLLTPTDNEYALAWRAACRAKNAKPRPKSGDKIRFAHPIPFTDGVERDTFTFVKGSQFRASDGVRVQVSRWRDRDFEVVA